MVGAQECQSPPELISSGLHCQRALTQYGAGLGVCRKLIYCTARLATASDCTNALPRSSSNSSSTSSSSRMIQASCEVPTSRHQQLYIIAMA
eukprot:4079-Heterococcus_DN1.PRE.6